MTNDNVVVKCTSSSPQDIEGRMSDQDATVTITRAEWQKLMSMLQTLSANQAELSQNQAELIRQLARANERVKELEEKNEELRAKKTLPQTCEDSGESQGQGGSKSFSRSPSFQYTPKSGPPASKSVSQPYRLRRQPRPNRWL